MIEAKRKKVEFPDSGKVGYIYPVSSSAVTIEFMQRYPRPRPPVQMVDFGDGVKRREVNYAHPDYKIAVREWTAFVDAEVQQESLRRATAVTLSDEQIKEVEAWKAANPDHDETMKDSAIWFWRIAIETDDDFVKLVNAVTGVSEQEVDAIQDTFPGDV